MEPTRRQVLLGALGLAAAGCTTSGSAPSSPPRTTAGTPTPTATGGREPLRFVVASDGHYGESGTAFRRYFDEFTGWVNALHALHPVDLVIFNGDIGHAAEHLPAAKKALGALPVPLIVNQGNHDGATPRQWRRVWGVEQNYVHQVKGAAFVLAATSDVAGTYGCADASWLTRALDQTAHAKDVFVVLHVPPVRLTRYDADCPAVVSLAAARPNVRGVLMGHDHDRGDIVTAKGLPLMYDTRVGGHWGTPKRGFRVVEVDEAGTLSTWIQAAGNRGAATTFAPRG